MKAFKATFQHGHFIDMETKKRIIPRQGGVFHISAEDNAFTTEDAKLKINDALNSKDKEAWAIEKYGEANYIKIMGLDDLLFFRVGNSKLAEGDESIQYIFLCKLLEDLYLYRMKGKEQEENESWRLADCNCKLEKCLQDGLTLSENLAAISPNKLFSHTVQFYFSLQRAGSANAFNTFYPYDPKMNITFEGATWQRYRALKDLRAEYVRKKK